MRTSYSEDNTSAAISEGASLAGEPIVVQSPSMVDRLAVAIAVIRPKQWTKNGLVLLALIFARRLTDVGAVERVLVAFLAFCLAASAVYVINDIADREKDRQHPVKRNRPIASGRLTLRAAWTIAGVCILGAALLVAIVMSQEPPRAADPFGNWGGSALLFALTLGCYVVMNLAYSSWLKHQVLWDVFIIAAGFVLRAVAGAFAIPVPISPWFYLCTTFLALFLALGKRRTELVLMSDSAANTRSNLREYNLILLDQLLAVVVTCVLITYSLYTFQGENANHSLMITIPFVIFGVFRYLYLLYVKGEGERPDELLWRDRQILGSVVLCVVAVMVLLYGIPLIQG